VHPPNRGWNSTGSLLGLWGGALLQGVRSLLTEGILRAVLRRRSVQRGILHAAVLWCSCVRLRPTKIDRGRGTGSVPSTKVDPGGGSGGAFGPQTTREAVADDPLHPVHTTHADHECHRGGDEALDEDRASG
jgi:hypothetical protein